MIYIIIFLSLILVICGFVISNLLNQVRQLEQNIDEISTESEQLQTTNYNLFIMVLKMVNQAKADMDRIDYRGAFKSDDEVGFTFKALQTIIDTLAEELNKIKE